MKNSEDIWQGIFNKINPIHNPKIVPLEPGYELDRLIAEKVLGWYQESDIGGPRAWWLEKSKADEILSKGPYPKASQSLYLEHFSTDIKAAWDLVEKFKLCVMPWAGQWMAYRNSELSKDSERHIAPTAPHAICLAALFYAGEDDE